MLSIDEYNYIKLLYDKFFKTNKYINTLMKNNEWDSVEFAVRDKETLIKQILQFEKVNIDKIKTNNELLKIRQDLINLEKDNIELLMKMKEELKQEMNAVSKTKKVLNAYEPSSAEILSTVNFSNED